MRLPSTSTKQIISFKICKLLPCSSIIITSNPTILSLANIMTRRQKQYTLPCFDQFAEFLYGTVQFYKGTLHEILMDRLKILLKQQLN